MLDLGPINTIITYGRLCSYLIYTLCCVSADPLITINHTLRQRIWFVWRIWFVVGCATGSQVTKSTTSPARTNQASDHSWLSWVHTPRTGHWHTVTMGAGPPDPATDSALASSCLLAASPANAWLSVVQHPSMPPSLPCLGPFHLPSRRPVGHSGNILPLPTRTRTYWLSLWIFAWWPISWDLHPTEPKLSAVLHGPPCPP